MEEKAEKIRNNKELPFYIRQAVYVEKILSNQQLESIKSVGYQTNHLTKKRLHKPLSL